MNQQRQTSLSKYHLIFVGSYFGFALLSGVLRMMMGSKGGSMMLVGVTIAALAALTSFNRDHGRGLDDSERSRMRNFALLFVGAINLVGVVVIKWAYDHSPLNVILQRKMPSGLLLLAMAVVMGLAWLSLWFVYGWYNRRFLPAGNPASVAAAPIPPSKKRVLVIGSGGREHALAWKLAQSPRVLEVLVAPGNAGTSRENKCRNVDVSPGDIEALVGLVRRENVDLTVVGPEGPLVAGIVDRFRSLGLRIFGPTANAAQLEGSKAFAKDFLARHGIPTAGYAVFSDLDAALAHVRARGAPIVIKADGLAAGKGVVVAMTLPEAEAAITDMLGGNVFGSAGSRVVVEEFLQGEEASFIVMSDGRNILPMATSQDHKRIGDGDTGPNTGGMGAYSPAPVVTPEVHQRVMREVIEPTIRGMAADGAPFSGFLYAGLMIDESGAPKVIEFNVRFGDPETQPVMLRLQSDLFGMIEAAVDQRLNYVDARWNPRPALGVVMAAANYPESPRTGDAIRGLDSPAAMGAKLFHAGTRRDGDQVVTSGGRVLCACALGDTVKEAQREAYELVGQIHWDGEYHRSDIGWRAIARERA